MNEEILDIVDEMGRPTGERAARSKAHAQGLLHRTTHLWILRKRDGRYQVLLQKRCENKDSFPGCYDISSAGHIPAGYGFEESAIRELKEELGVEAKEKDLIDCGSRLIKYDGYFGGKVYRDRQYSKVYVLMLDKEEDEFVPQPEEVESVKWVDLEWCLNEVKKTAAGDEKEISTDDAFKHCIEYEELKMVKDLIEN